MLASRLLEQLGVTLIAFHLPQFHRIRENDEWWGKGFTEWTNVRKARPLFPGHDQPHEPCDRLGYYNLLEPGVFERQVRLAQRAGIGGFCFYHFWFDGKLLLEKPLELWLAKKELSFRFCLCWANEPWTRRWDGSDSEVLQPQQYGCKAAWLRHFSYLQPALEDSRAIRVDGRPVILVYRIGHIPEPAAMFDCWREEALSQGLAPPFVVAMLNGFRDPDARAIIAADGVAEFAPFAGFREVGQPDAWIVDYDEAWMSIINIKRYHPIQFRGSFVSWDNTPRRGRLGKVFWRATPEKYKHYLKLQMHRLISEPRSRRLLFVNAWNEWGEGCYLEPDQAMGPAYLEATRDAVEELLGPTKLD